MPSGKHSTIQCRLRVWSLLICILASLAFSGCILFSQTRQYIPANPTPVPIVNIEDGYSSAILVAQSWNSGSYLASTTGVYEIGTQGISIARGVYDFVSESQDSYLSVTVYANGKTDNLAPADFEGSLVSGTPYMLERNRISESDALEKAWAILGERVHASCGPTERITVKIWATFTEKQLWLITYWSEDGIAAKIAIDSRSGETTNEPDINEATCILP